MKRILFVDDEKPVLDGLRRTLRAFRKEWDMKFANSGEDALAEMEKAGYDVVVTEMRMPGMDGAKLLEKVKELYPGTIRIILTGHTELDTALRAIPIAHNFLNKPCEASMVKEVVLRAVNLQELLTDDGLKQKIDSMNGLPAMPGTYARLIRAMEDGEVTLEGIVSIIENDAAISSRILQTVNSGFFGRPQRISEFKSAISFIGFKLLKTLLLSVEVFHANTFINLPAGFSLIDEHHHAILVGRIASRIAPELIDANEAFMTGLLHDVGILVLASQMPAHFEQIQHRIRDQQISLVSHKIYQGIELTSTEQSYVDKLPKITESILGDIPRLEAVREILYFQHTHFDGKFSPQQPIQGEAIPLGAKMLKLVLDCDSMLSKTGNEKNALGELQHRTGWYDLDLLEELLAVTCQPEGKKIHVRSRGIKVGMIFAEDLLSDSGQLLVARGQEINTSIEARVHNWAMMGSIPDELLMIIQEGVKEEEAEVNPLVAFMNSWKAGKEVPPLCVVRCVAHYCVRKNRPGRSRPSRP